MFKVQKQVLDLYYHDEENARAFQDHAKRLYYAKILPEMQAIMEKHDVRQNIIKINGLELDLGQIYEEEFDAEWPKKFAAEFEDQLLKRLLLIQSEKSVTEDESIPITKQVSEIFEYYLLNGTLPWNADYVKHTPSWMMEHLLDQHPNDLIHILKKYGSKPNVVRRIVLQFPEKLLIRTVERMHPTEAQFIVETVNEIDRTRKKESFVKTDSVHFRSKLWEFVFSYILNDRGSYFNTKSYVKSMLFGIADHFNMERELLIKQFYQAAFLLKKDISLSNDLWQIISEIHEETEFAENESTHFEKTLFEKILKNQEQNKKTIDIPLTEENTQHILEQLIFQPVYHDMIRNWLAEKGRDTEFQRKIGRAIRTQKQFEKLVRIIDSLHADYIIGFSKRLQEDQEKQYIFPVSSTQFRQNQYQIIITVLLVDRGSYFNKKSFVKQVLQQLAAQYGITYKELLTSIINSVPRHMKSMAQLPDVIQLLEDLRQDEDKNVHTYKDKQQTIPPEELEKLIDHWVKNRVMPTWINEFVGIQKIPFQNLWMQLLAEVHLHENWLHHFLQNENNIYFLEEMFGESGISHTIQRLIPSSLYREIYQFTSILGEVFAMQSLISMDLKTFERKKSVFLLGYTHALRNQQMDIALLAEKALVYFAQIWQVNMSEILQQCIVIADSSNMASPITVSIFQKITAQQKNKNSRIPVSDKVEILMEEFLLRTAGESRTSSKYNDDLYNTLIQLQSVSAQHTLVFLHKIFSEYSFYDFINKSNHGKLLNLLKENVLNIHGYFLSALLQDMVYVLKKTKIPLPGIDIYLSKAIIYTWFSDKKSEKEYISNILHFISELKKTNIKEVKKTLKDIAIQHKIELKSKIILHLSSEEAADIEKREKEDNIKQDSKLVIPYTKEKEETIMDTIAVKNAGLVLVWPFITLYFERLHLTQSNVFIDEHTQQRAVHLLQYLANQRYDYPEHGLTLPKILCGISPSEAIIPGIEIKEEEKNMAESLLGGIIQQWSILKNTSPAALRDSFLNRPGLLYQKEKGWELHVEPQSFDVLLDKRPWGIQIIKLPWMTTTLYCKWR